jgi:hypothetical protein
MRSEREKQASGAQDIAIVAMAIAFLWMLLGVIFGIVWVVHHR